MFASRCRFRLQVAKPDSAPIYRSCVWLCSWEALITMLTGRLPAEPFPQGIRFWNQKVRIGDHIQGSPQPISSPCKRSVLQVDANWTGSPLCSKALKNNGDKASGNSAVPLRQLILNRSLGVGVGSEQVTFIASCSVRHFINIFSSQAQYSSGVVLGQGHRSQSNMFPDHNGAGVQQRKAN